MYAIFHKSVFYYTTISIITQEGSALASTQISPGVVFWGSIIVSVLTAGFGMTLATVLAGLWNSVKNSVLKPNGGCSEKPTTQPQQLNNISDMFPILTAIKGTLTDQTSAIASLLTRVAELESVQRSDVFTASQVFPVADECNNGVFGDGQTEVESASDDENVTDNENFLDEDMASVPWQVAAEAAPVQQPVEQQQARVSVPAAENPAAMPEPEQGNITDVEIQLQTYKARLPKPKSKTPIPAALLTKLSTMTQEEAIQELNLEVKRQRLLKRQPKYLTAELKALADEDLIHHLRQEEVEARSKGRADVIEIPLEVRERPVAEIRRYIRDRQQEIQLVRQARAGNAPVLCPKCHQLKPKGHFCTTVFELPTTIHKGIPVKKVVQLSRTGRGPLAVRQRTVTDTAETIAQHERLTAARQREVAALEEAKRLATLTTTNPILTMATSDRRQSDPMPKTVRHSTEPDKMKDESLQEAIRELTTRLDRLVRHSAFDDKPRNGAPGYPTLTNPQRRHPTSYVQQGYYAKQRYHRSFFPPPPRQWQQPLRAAPWQQEETVQRRPEPIQEFTKCEKGPEVKSIWDEGLEKGKGKEDEKPKGVSDF